MPKKDFKKEVGKTINFTTMAKSSGLKNAPSTTGKPSGGGRGNNSKGGKK